MGVDSRFRTASALKSNYKDGMKKSRIKKGHIKIVEARTRRRNSNFEPTKLFWLDFFHARSTIPFQAKSSSTLRPLDVKSWDFLLYFSDGLTDCEDPECCENPVCRKSQLCHTVPFPIDILLRKQPPSATASFFERMKFIIEDKGLQSYVEKAGFNERYVENVILVLERSRLFSHCVKI